MSLNYGTIWQNVAFWCVLMLKIALTWSWSKPIYWYIKCTNNDRHILHALLDKDYKSPGMIYWTYVQSYFVCILVYCYLKYNSIWLTLESYIIIFEQSLIMHTIFTNVDTKMSTSNTTYLSWKPQERPKLLNQYFDWSSVWICLLFTQFKNSLKPVLAKAHKYALIMLITPLK